MGKTLRAVFDGKVLRPEEPADLEPNTRYVVTVEPEVEPSQASAVAAYPLTEILALATDMGVEDLASHHRRYAHGGPDDGNGGNSS